MNSEWNRSLLAEDFMSGALSLTRGSGTIILWLGAGLVIAALLVLAFRGLMMLKDRAKAIPFGNLIKGAAGRSPAGVADPAKVARLDDLRKKFEEGVEKFKSAGKDLYSLPWYLLVGPAGSGKTEALRHCKVGFPPGLQDCFQGAGGTLNMHWWFMNQAVVLDTAGRMFMEEAALQGGSEWREFLKLLKQSRPNAPMNGMLLVIGVDSLIKDTAEQIEAKAGHIAKQLDTIQRTLDVRFPVYVVITKCDLITGFREFFDKIDDPQLQHQMLGWSNPASLDEAFKADGVENHIKTVRSRLLKYRAGLMIDPVHTEDPQARRTDQIDELFSLPDNLAKIAPRLRKYLEIIFQAGEWSPKPLFLRGIYFSSSMRQGQALDEEVAAAMGVPVDAIPGGKVWDEERSFFLRDIFVSKIFKERGLVTRATNVHKEQTGRRRKLIGVGIGVVAVLIALTVYTGWRLKNEVQDPQAFWKSVATVAEHPSPDGSLLALVKHKGGTQYFDMSSTTDYTEALKGTDLDAKGRTLIELISDVKKQGATAISTGAFSPISGLNNRLHDAYVAVLKISIFDPVVRRARIELAKADNSAAWEGEFKARLAVAALAELTRAETLARELTPASAKGDAKGDSNQATVNVHALVSFLARLDGKAPDDKDVPDDKLLKPDLVVDDIMSKATSEDLRKSGVFGSKASLGELEAATASAAPSWVTIGKSKSYDLGKLVQLHEAAKSFAKEEKEVLREPFVNDQKFAKAMPKTLDEYNQLATAHNEGLARLSTGTYARLSTMYKENAGVRDKLGSATLASDVVGKLQVQFDEVLKAIPADLTGNEAKELANLDATLKKSSESAKTTLKDEATNLASTINGLNSPDSKALLDKSPAAGEPGFVTIFNAHKELDKVLVKAEALKDWSGTVSTAAGVTTSVTAALSAVEKLKADSNPSLQPSAIFADINRGIAVARGARLTASMKGLLSELDAKKPLKASIDGASIAEDDLPVIALTDLKAPEKPQYGHNATQQFLQAWKVVKDATDGSQADLIVDGKTLKNAIQEHRNTVAAYAANYATYWITVYDNRATVMKFDDWKSFVAQYREKQSSVTSDTINRPLKKLSRQLADALKLNDELFGPIHEKKIKDLEAQYAAYGEGVGDKAISSMKDALQTLMTDGDSVSSARARIVASNQGAIDQLQPTVVTNYGQYWNDLPIRALEALARSSDSEAQIQANNLKNMVKFPLINSQKSQAMSWDDLAGVETALKALPTADAQSVNSNKAQSFDPKLRQVIEAIVNPGKESVKRILSTEKVEKVERMLKLYRANASGRSLVKSLTYVSTEPAEIPVGFKSARAKAEAVQFEVPGLPPQAVMRLEDAAVELPDGRPQGLGINLHANPQSTKPLADAESKQFSDPWCAAFMLSEPGVTKDANNSEWLVPIVITCGPDKLWFRVKVKLRVDFPNLNDWPDSITP